jgi:ATP-dependent RNA helicase RhlE
MTFDELKLHPTLLQAVKAEGYTTPTPIQAQAIPHVLAQRDVLGCAQTGTGKTAAFALPILQRLSATTPQGLRPIRCLVLTPTRELATQIGDSFATYGQHTGLRHTVIFGGVSQGAQVQALRRGVDILVATPGRLLDLLQQRLVSFQALEIFVLDEADRMLDMGFIHDVKRIINAIPKKRQTLFFSATMPQEIQALSQSILVDPVRIEVTPVATTAETVDQSVYFVEKPNKRALLNHLLKDPAIKLALVFTRTKSGANRVTRDLQAAGVGADAIHGNKSQNARERALDAFKDGSIRVLVATDIAARGIDVEGITHVVNFDLPNIPESYVHRIGRTGRAGAAGIAISFCDHEERAYLKDIEKTIRRQVPVIGEHPYVSTGAVQAHAPRPPQQQHSQRPKHHQQRRHRGGGGGGSHPQRSSSEQSSGQGQQRPVGSRRFAPR